MRDLSGNTALLSLNTATVREQWNLRQCIEGCARHGLGAIAPWRDKLQECGVGEAAKMIADNGLRVSSLCRGGFFTGDTNNLDDNFRAVDEAVAINAECLIIVAGGLPSGSKDIEAARKKITDDLRKMLTYARSCKMPLAIEPLHPMYAADRSSINTLSQAIDICTDLGEGIGIAVDVYHVWWDPELEKQLERAGSRNLILGYHVCDWLVPTEDLLLDRGMMGDGIIDLIKIRQWVEKTGYDGCIEVEIFSKGIWWKKKPDEVLEVCIDRFQTIV
ncbi:MAG TPA: sugar phosphate isomerase/epimerase [Flavobacteriales bacterium]|nr:sugar phosphate isomerase/epimerase [Flavobacteriales bacterium]